MLDLALARACDSGDAARPHGADLEVREHGSDAFRWQPTLLQTTDDDTFAGAAVLQQPRLPERPSDTQARRPHSHRLGWLAHSIIQLVGRHMIVGDQAHHLLLALRARVGQYDCQVMVEPSRFHIAQQHHGALFDHGAAAAAAAAAVGTSLFSRRSSAHGSRPPVI